MKASPCIRILSYPSVSWMVWGVAAGVTTEGWQDKRAHGALQSGGCFCSCFWRVPHRAALARTVRLAPILLNFLTVLHRAGRRHVR